MGRGAHWRHPVLCVLVVAACAAASAFNMPTMPDMTAEIKRANQEEWVADITGDWETFDADAPVSADDLPDEDPTSALVESLRAKKVSNQKLDNLRQSRPHVWHQLLEVAEGVQARSLAKSMTEKEGSRWGMFSQKRSEAGTMVQTGSWYPRGGHTWKLSQGCGHRIAAKTIGFQKNFLRPPAVLASLRALDIVNGHARKVNVFATNINVRSFTVVIQTWGCTQVNNAGLAWMAMGLDSVSYYRNKFLSTYTKHLTTESHHRKNEYNRNVRFLGVLQKEMKFRTGHMARENHKTLTLKKNFAALLQKTHLQGKDKIEQTIDQLKEMEEMRKALQKKLRDIWARHKKVLARIRYEVEEVRKVTHPVFLKRLDMLSKWQNNRYEEIAYEMNEMWHHTKTIRAKMFQRRRLLRAIIYHQRDLRRSLMSGATVDKRIKCSCKDAAGSSSMGLKVDKECSCTGGDVNPQGKVFQPTIQIPPGG